MTSPPGSTARAIDIVLSRVVVPLWILAGAVFKLSERTPGNLPSAIVRAGKDYAGSNNLDTNVVLDVLLRSLIGLEFLAVGVMFLLPRFARYMGVFMMASFCAILVNELRLGAASCGCFGSVKINPAVMLAIDGSLLAGLIIFGVASKASSVPASEYKASRAAPWAIVAFLVWIAAGFGISFAMPEKSAAPIAEVQVADHGSKPLPENPPQPPTTEPPKGTTPEPTPGSGHGTSVGSTPPVCPDADPTVNPNVKKLTKNWYSPNTDDWKGKPWREIDLFQLMPKWPKDLDKGRHYVVFYRKTCDHCHMLLDLHFFDQPLTPTVLIAIPPSPGDPAEKELPMPTRVAQFLDLPRGTQWMITAPILVAIEDGKVICAKEGEEPENPECLIWPR